jgi:hypothetical protein
LDAEKAIEALGAIKNLKLPEYVDYYVLQFCPQSKPHLNTGAGLMPMYVPIHHAYSFIIEVGASHRPSAASVTGSRDTWELADTYCYRGRTCLSAAGEA